MPAFVLNLYKVVFCGVVISLLATANAQPLLAAEVVMLAGTGEVGTSPDGSLAAESKFGEPYGVVIGPDGQLYVCEIATHMIRRIDLKTGRVERVVGSGTQGYAGDGGPALQAELNEPYEVRFDSQGNLVYVEMKSHVVRRVNRQTGIIETLAGTGTAGYSGDGGPAIKAQLKQPHSIVLDEADNLYICDIGNHRVRVVDAQTGVISTLAGGGTQLPVTGGVSELKNLNLRGPRALDYQGGGVFVLALREGNMIFRLDLNRQTLTHLGGTGQSGFTGHGADARQAKFSGPKGVAIDHRGDIYFADTESHTIRVIRADSGIVETVAGDGQRGDGPDGPEPLNCRMARPHSVCVDTKGNVYIGDSENHRVRMLKVE